MEANDSIRLRFEFIEMMFALAIAQVAIEFGEFFKTGLPLREHLYILTHLVLVTYIISSSWIGWQQSVSHGNKEKINNVFGLSFFILLLDLLLVILYFSITISVEQESKDLVASAKEEVYWSMWIFGVYFIWDFFTKFIKITDRDPLKIKYDLKTFILRGYQSLLCYFIILLFIRPMTVESSNIEVYLIDITLIFIFWLFRGLKELKKILDIQCTKTKIFRFTVAILVPATWIIYFIITNQINE